MKISKGMKEFKGPPWLRTKLNNNLSPWICVCFEMGHMCIIVRCGLKPTTIGWRIEIGRERERRRGEGSEQTDRKRQTIENLNQRHGR